MIKLNSFLYHLEKDNCFQKVSKKISEYQNDNPNTKIISLGIGDVSKPIVKPIIVEMHKAVEDLASMETFKGYGSYYGYAFLKDKIRDNDYKDFKFTNEEIYISNGVKSDSTNILELFPISSKILVTDPMYPIYKEGSTCLNRKVYTIPSKEEDDFIAKIPKKKYNIIYICSPSNPTGIAYTKEDLKLWINYAIKNNAVILYDNVYESFIQSPDVPHSIYEIEGAKKVAIEFRSFSKKASFTGVRCSYYVIPKELNINANKLWQKRTINRFNGADYIAQKGAEASYLPKAQELIKKNINYYMENAKYLRDNFNNLGFKVYGGIDSPFMWVKTKDNQDSWDLFDIFLKKLNVVIIPGSIFGKNSYNYFRVSALGKKEDCYEAMERIKKYYEKI